MADWWKGEVLADTIKKVFTDKDGIETYCFVTTTGLYGSLVYDEFIQQETILKLTRPSGYQLLIQREALYSSPTYDNLKSEFLLDIFRYAFKLPIKYPEPPRKTLWQKLFGPP